MATNVKDKLVNAESMKKLHDYSEKTYARKEDISSLSSEIDNLKSLISSDVFVSFLQQNPQLTAYLKEADNNYTDSNYKTMSVASSYLGDYDDPVGYNLNIDENGTIYFDNETDSKYSWSSSVTAGNYTVYDLIPEQTYDWYVVNDSGKTVQSGKLKATGKVRMIYDSNANSGETDNMRDLGGWQGDSGRVKYGILYRGEIPTHLTTSTKARVKDVLRINSQIDLYAVGSPRLLYTGIDYHALPLSDSSLLDDLSGSYEDTFAQALTVAMTNAVNGVTSYIHCWAGSDRTGLICWVLHLLLGCSIADCDKDYEITTLSNRANRYRNASGWLSVTDYFMGLGATTMLDNVLHWCDLHSIDITLINNFRKAMISGNPKSLAYPTVVNPEPQPEPEPEVQVNMLTKAVNVDGASVYNDVGYKEGVYCSTNDIGTYSADAKYFATGCIPIPKLETSPSIYIKGAWFESASHSRLQFGYKKEGGTVGTVYTTGQLTNLTNITSNFDIVELGTDYHKLTPKSSYSLDVNALELFFRFSMPIPSTGTDKVYVSINKEITD